MSRPHPDPPRPLPRRAVSRLRRAASIALFGVDVQAGMRNLEADLATVQAELRALHIAISEAVLDLGEDLKEGLARETDDARAALVKRTDLLLERFDKKLEGLFAALSRRLADLEASGDVLGDEERARFRERLWGSAAEVRERLPQYARLLDGGPVAVLGCGRGDLLEALREAGVQAYGVDVNDSLAERARGRGFEVFREEALEHLGRLPENGLRGIAATDLVEHLSPIHVQRLLAEAARVLAPGGRVVLECANPTSVWALTRSWVRDPSHVWAVHPDTLSFMAAKAGLAVIDVLYTAPVPDEERLKADDPDTDRLNQILYGPQMFVLAAQKPVGEGRLG